MGFIKQKEIRRDTAMTALVTILALCVMAVAMLVCIPAAVILCVMAIIKKMFVTGSSTPHKT
jgi:hypothetical protein